MKNRGIAIILFALLLYVILQGGYIRFYWLLLVRAVGLGLTIYDDSKK